MCKLYAYALYDREPLFFLVKILKGYWMANTKSFGQTVDKKIPDDVKVGKNGILTINTQFPLSSIIVKHVEDCYFNS